MVFPLQIRISLEYFYRFLIYMDMILPFKNQSVVRIKLSIEDWQTPNKV